MRFTCDYSRDPEALPHFWEYCVGSGHATLALRADWQAQLKQCHDELGFRHVRFHGILDDDMGTLDDEKKEPLYSFHNADQIYDFLRSIQMRPIVELSFMPKALASGDKTTFHYHGNITPPSDYGLWATLVSKLASHWIDRYGVTKCRRGRWKYGTSRIWTASGPAVSRTTSGCSKPAGRRSNTCTPISRWAAR